MKNFKISEVSFWKPAKYGTSAETLRDGKTIIFCSKFTREKLIEIIIVCYTKTKNTVKN